MSSAESGKTKSGRNIQFNFQQNQVLVTLVLQHYDLLYGAKAQRTSSSRKNEIWTSISENVSAESNHRKTVEHCKKRFSDIKRILKAKLAKEKKSRRQTGGGAAFVAELSSYENMLMERLGDNMVLGVEDFEHDTDAMAASISAASAVATQALPVVDPVLIVTDSSHSFSSATTLPDIMCSTPDPGAGQTTVDVRRAMGPAPTSSISSSSGTERCHQLSEELTIVVSQMQETLFDESQELIGTILSQDAEEIESFLEASAASTTGPAAPAAAPGPAAPGPAAPGPAAPGPADDDGAMQHMVNLGREYSDNQQELIRTLGVYIQQQGRQVEMAMELERERIAIDRRRVAIEERELERRERADDENRSFNRNLFLLMQGTLSELRSSRNERSPPTSPTFSKRSKD